jgi:hypothetical protein
MGTGASSYPQPEGLAATYWRRRFLALVAGLAVLALIAWAFSGALGGGARNLAAASGSGGGGHAANQGGGAGVGGAGPGASPAQPSPSASTPSVQPSVSASSPGKTGGTTGSPAPDSSSPGSSASPGSPADQGGRQSKDCRRRDVVLSLSAGQDSFGARELPVFDVDVVSTAAGSCAFNVGAKHVMLVIRADNTRVWGSADCVKGPGSLITKLDRGVPTVLPISWDRQISSPGCKIASSQASARTYTATAVDGTDVSNTVTFRLS